MNVVPEKLYYIYMDTKIIGAVEQLVRYFQAQIFTKDACICVLCKYYKEVEKKFKIKFDEHHINFRFIRKQSDINLQKGKTIFYLFNAQSNCRLVANRDLTHIFVTHGESHKLASIKPIIRIYDYVVTSGQVGIDRYLKSGIFSEYDIQKGKVITLGNTFIGDNKYIYDESAPSLVYAPTWEGGVPDEDYCSVCDTNAKKIIEFCYLYRISTVYVQPHPNLGHRIKSKRKDLLIMISMFENAGLKVYVIGIPPVKKITDLFFKNKTNAELPSLLSVQYALTDISAMEVQFLYKGIPCGIFTDKMKVKNLAIPKALIEHYNERFIYGDNEVITKCPPMRKDYYNYFFSYPLRFNELMSFDERVIWLCKHLEKERVFIRRKLFDCF